MCERCKQDGHKPDPYADVRREGPATAMRCSLGQDIASHKGTQTYADLRAVDAMRSARGMTIVKEKVVVVRRRRIAALVKPQE